MEVLGFQKRFSFTFVLVQFTEGSNLSYSPLAGGSEPSSPKQGFVYSVLSFSEYFVYGFIASNKAGLVLHCGELHQSRHIPKTTNHTAPCCLTPSQLSSFQA